MTIVELCQILADLEYLLRVEKLGVIGFREKAYLKRLRNIRFNVHNLTEVKAMPDCKHELSYQNYDGRMLCAECEKEIPPEQPSLFD